MHIITDLDTGGAEMMLYKLVSGLDREKFLCRVISIASTGVVGHKIKNLGIQVDTLAINRGFLNPLLALFRMIRMLRSWKPDIVQTWLYHADLLGSLAVKAAASGVLVWNIRCTNMDLSRYRKTTRWVMWACAALSRYPQTVIANSHAAIEFHQRRQYRPKWSMVIPNGFDLDHFKPDQTLRIQVRRQFGIPEYAPCIGLVARFDPMKDHRTFFSAAKIINRKRPNTHFVLCGEGVIWQNPRVRSYLGKSETVLKVHLLGHREDIYRIMAGFDIFVLSSSYGESFPNVIGEAMATSVPCVVTEVGDSRRIVGGTGRIVPPKNPLALANAVLGLLDLPAEELHELGERARERIRKYYSLDKIVADYEKLYQDIAVC